VGFLLGLSAAGASSFWYLLDEYQRQALTLISSVDSVDRSVEKVKAQLQKVDAVQKELEELKRIAAYKQDIEELRKNLIKSIDVVHMEHLELKSQVSLIEKDLSRGV
ncbi:hypothetical protein MP638_000716, partial [Amoeboaphelidium occidentale]